MTRISLFDELKKGGYESCLITTYNIHFPFYEDVLLRRMQSAGIDHHLVLVDNSMCIQAINAHQPVKAGFHYSLAPMKSKASFHPKILLLLGKRKGLLAVGSHNLTLSGFGTNLEVTNVIKFNNIDSKDSLSIFQSAMNACSTWIDDYGNELPDGIKESFAKITDSCTWLRDDISETTDYASFYFSSFSTPSLWSQVNKQMPDNLVSITGMSAFFDSSLSFVNTLLDLDSDNFKIGVQDSTVKTPNELTSFNQIKIVDSNSLLEKDGSAYIHAKLIYSESETEQLLITGSANLSAPAWLASGEYANAEAIIILHNEFAVKAKESLGLKALDNALEINAISSDINEESDTDTNSIVFIVANYTQGEELRIPWDSDDNGLEIGYLDALNKFSAISCKASNKNLIISNEFIRDGEIIHIRINSKLCAYVMIHNNSQIKAYSSSGKERQLRLALGSLNTYLPNVEVIFDLINGFILNDSRKIRKAPSSIGNNQTKNKSNKESRETLMVSIDDYRINKESGRRNLHYGDDASLFLDVLISSLSIDRSVNSSGLNEDSLGRNEEEQVGKDDSIDDIDNSQLSDIDIDNHIKLKVKTMLSRLDQYLEKNGIEYCQAALGVLVFICGLLDIRKESVDKKQLYKLLEIIAGRLLDDKDPMYLDDRVYASDEWGKLIGYTTWLACKLDIKLHSNPVLSESKIESDKTHWENALFYYLVQHVAADEYARKVADGLITESCDAKMAQWLVFLKFIGESPEGVNNRKSLELSIAKSISPKGYPGYRIITNKDVNGTWLSSVKGAGQFTKFQSEYLTLIL